MAITRRYQGISGPAAVQPGVVLVTGRVAIGSTGAVGTQTGSGFSVARVSAGLYTVTVTAANGVLGILSAWVHVGNNSATVQHIAYVKAFSTTAGTVTVMTAAVDTPETAADAVSGAFLEILVFVQNMSITS